MMKKLFGISVLALGLSLASNAMAADVAASCAGCHGTDGVTTDQNIPTIAGASATYISSTLNDYKKKTRPCSEVTVLSGDKKGQKSDMCKVAADLSPADIDALAKTFSAKPFVKFKQPVDAALAAKGKEINAKLCDKCHTEGGTVAEDDSGILGGQPIPYLKAQLQEFKDGKRPVPQKMKPKLDEVQPSDFDALANFYASSGK